LIKTVRATPDPEAIIEATNDFLHFSEQVDKEVSRIVALSFAEGLRERNPHALTSGAAHAPAPSFD